MSEFMAEMMSHIIEIKGSVGGLNAKVDSLSSDVGGIKKVIADENKEIHERIDSVETKTQSLLEYKKKIMWTSIGVGAGAGLGSANLSKIFAFIGSLITGH